MGSIQFVTNTREMQRVAPGEVLYAPLASTRFRVLLPAAEVARHREVFLIPLEVILDGADVQAAAAVVLAKLPIGVVARFDGGTLSKLEKWMIRAKRETRLFADLTDDFVAMASTFRAQVLADYQQLLARHCSLVVPTRAFADNLAAAGVRHVQVIEDPYESRSARRPKEFSDGPLRLCWFGNLAAPNAGFLRSQIGRLSTELASQTVALEMVAAASAASTVQEIGRHAAMRNRNFSVSFTEWSLSSVEDALQRADLVLIPHELEMPWTHVMSHNRLVTAIRAGRFAIASPIPSYQELASYAWLGNSLAHGIQWAMTHPSEVTERIVAGQAYIESRFSPSTIGQKWLHALAAD